MAEILPPGSDTAVMTTSHALLADTAIDRATPVIVHPHPFSTYTHPLVMAEGMNVKQIVEASGIPAIYHDHVHVWIDDHQIPRELWTNVKPKVGRYVYVKVVPGKKGGKNILGSLLMLVVVIAAAIFAPMIVGAMGITEAAGYSTMAISAAKGLVSAAITLVGGLLVQALVPPPKTPTTPDNGLVSPRALLTGIQNRFAPYADIPRIYGKRRIYPMQAARPYTEAVGNNRYVRILLCCGWGPLAISDIKIGETPITAFENIEVQTREGWVDATFGTLPSGKTADTPQTLFTNSVHEEAFNILLDPNEPQSRFSDQNASELSVDINFPAGLAHYDDNGNKQDRTVSVTVEYRKVGTTAWTSVVWDGNDKADGTETNGTIIATDKSATAVGRGGRWKVSEAAQYEIRLTRTTAKGGNRDVDRCEWSNLRTIRHENPLNVSGLALIALRMRATDQFNGLPDTINCVVQSYIPQYNGSTWAYGLSRNPAWAYADIMRRRGNERILNDSRIDLTAIRDWATAANATASNANEPKWQFDGIFEGGAIFTALRQIAGHGRASFVVKDGKYSVVRDIQQTVPIQHITPRNSFGYSGSKSFVDLPHALKVSFINADKGYQEDETIVYADGYGLQNATKFESLDLPACTSQKQAWREARYFMAVGKLRPEEHTVTMDIEALRCTLGDLVRLSHDVLSIGIASGRIISRVMSDGRVVGFTIDNQVPMLAGNSYALRVRLATGQSNLYTLASVTESQNVSTVTLATSIALSVAPDRGDLFIFGDASRESAPMIVKKIEPGPDMTAKLTLVDAQDGVYTADTGAIPEFNTYISDDTPVAQQMPPMPSFALKSDETVIERLSDGTLQDRIGVTISALPSGKIDIAGFDIQFRDTGTLAWRGAATVSLDVRQGFISPVVQGNFYDVRVRTVSRSGIASNWAEIDGHKVVGKTTVPSNVTGFVATGRVDGIQLSWNSNPEIDVVAYEVRRGSTWDSAALVSGKVTGNSLFVGLSSSSTETFLIRAVDAIGLQSPSAVAATATLGTPDDVTFFEVYPQEDYIRSSWRGVNGTGVEYEIRNGETWTTARKVGRSAGTTLTVKWPIRTSGSPKFWIRAVSSAGIYSPNPYLASVEQAPLPNRNVVLDVDFSNGTWSGTRLDLTPVGTGVGSYLRVDQDTNGLSYEAGDYYQKISLVDRFYARNWIETSIAMVSSAGITWNDATFTWAASGDDTTWIGVITDTALAEINAYIAQDGGSVSTSVIEAFRLDHDLTGYNGTTPTESVGATYAPCRFTDGLVMNDFTSVGWDVAVPATFSEIFDFRPTAFVSTESFVVQTLRNSGVFLRLRYDAASQQYVLEDHAGQSISITVPTEIGDVITFCITQNVTTRALYAYTRRHPTVVSATGDFNSIGNFTSLALHAA